MTTRTLTLMATIIIIGSVLFTAETSHAQSKLLSKAFSGDNTINSTLTTYNTTYYANTPTHSIQMVPSRYAPGEKSPAVAFILEFFLGFGIGHYYAGNSNWATFGLVSGISLYGGMIYLISSIESSGNNIALPIMLIVFGAVGKMTSMIAAPIVTSQNNEKKRLKYYHSLRYNNNNQIFRYDDSLPSFFNSSNTKSGNGTLGQSNHGARFMVPVLSLTF
jgi:hypothetical protein